MNKKVLILITIITICILILLNNIPLKTISSNNSFNGTIIYPSIYSTYKAIIYLDPTDLTVTCNETLARENVNEYGAFTGVNKGCMKFYVFDETKEDYIMILDHNTSGDVAWNSNGTNEEIKEVEERLKSDTKGWVGSPRLITESEIRMITNKEKGTYYLGSGDQTKYIDQTKSQKLIQESYHWLFDNLAQSIKYGGSINDDNVYDSSSMDKQYITGYWTSSKVSGRTTSAWYIVNNGRLCNKDVDYDNCCGVRPVLTISKKILKR